MRRGRPVRRPSVVMSMIRSLVPAAGVISMARRMGSGRWDKGASRTESFDRFKERFPDGEVLLSPRGGPGFNPYAGYDSSSQPFLFRGDFPEGIAPLAYVVAVDDQAWSLDLLQKEKRIETDDLVITWEPGQNAAMDARNISQGRDIGNVVVQRRENGSLVDAVHDVTFAFAFNAFFPDGTIHK